MAVEYKIFTIVALLSIFSAAFIPKKKLKEALIPFLVFQSSTWFTSILLVQTKKITYPVREFYKATNINFIPQFLFYPSLFVWFILLFPKTKSIFRKAIHYIIFVSIMVWFIYFTSRYTNINKYTASSDFVAIRNTYLRNFVQYALCHIYVRWFFKNQNKT